MIPKGMRRGVYGGSKSNVRKKDEKPTTWEMPISTKHSICKKLYEARAEFPDEKDSLNHFSKKLMMRPNQLREIYKQRSIWEKEMMKHEQSTAIDERKQRSGLSKGKKASGGNQMRVRASRGGAKRQFPHLFHEIKIWLDKERSHGHGVQKMDLAWRYFQLLALEKRSLRRKGMSWKMGRGRFFV